MGLIATLLPNQTHARRLQLAVRAQHTLVTCGDWPALRRACETEPVHLAVLDLFATGPAAFEEVRWLRVHCPRVSLVAYVSLTHDHARDLFDAGKAGINGLVVADQDDAPRELLALIERAQARSAAEILHRAIELERQPPTVRDAVMLAITRAHEHLTPERLARLTGIPRRVLSKRLTDAGFPPPQRLITWGRLIMAAHMLESAHRSADRVALALDFPSGSAFRNTCQRYLHATPNQIRARGGSGYVGRLLLRQLRGVDAPAERPPLEPQTAQLAV